MQVKRVLYVIYCAVPLLLHVADSQKHCIFSIENAYCGQSNRYTLDYVPKISHRITQIRIVEQPLTQLPRYAFVNITTRNELVSISVDKCQIRLIDVDAFKNLNNLKYLDLAYNNIARLETGTFQHTKNLRTLDIRHNKLKFLQTGLFHNLTHLQSVHCSDNIITYIEQDTFRNTPSLFKIDVSNNKLQYLNPLFTDNFINITALFDGGNPWNCDCNLKEFYEKNKARNVEYARTGPICQDPPELRGRKLTNLTSDDFTCGARIISPKNDTRVLTVGSNVTQSSTVPSILHVADSQQYCEIGGPRSVEAYCSPSYTNRTFDYVPSISQRIEHIYLNDQPLKQLPRNACGNISSQSELTEIYLARCEVQHIDVDAFVNLGNLDVLSITGNSISRIETETFQHTKKLRIVKMRYNKIEILQTGLFHNLIHLQSVDFSDNIITHIEQDTFRNTPFLRFIDVESNKLENLSPLFTDKFIRVYRLHVGGNPWNCDCNLKEFYEKNKARKLVLDAARAICQNPPELRGRKWSLLASDDFNCDARIIFPQNDIRVVTVGSNVTLSCAVSADPPPYIEWYRNSKSIAKNKLFGSARAEPNMYYLNYTFTVQEEDLGGYYCIATNSAANRVESNITLTVNVTTK